MVYEKRTFIPKDKIGELITFFDNNASKKVIEKQVIYDYHTEGDFRLIKTKDYLKIDFKPVSVIEKENSVFIMKKYEEDLTEIFRKIGLFIDLKRFRIRHKYIYNNMYVTVDDNIKTGNIFRIKFHYETEEEKTRKIDEINNIFNTLSVEETDISKFQELYAKYRMDWGDLTKDIDENEFLK